MAERELGTLDVSEHAAELGLGKRGEKPVLSRDVGRLISCHPLRAFSNYKRKAMIRQHTTADPYYLSNPLFKLCASALTRALRTGLMESSLELKPETKWMHLQRSIRIARQRF